MAIGLIERPHRFCFAKNEARYVFFITNPQAAGCAVQVKLFFHSAKSPSQPAEEATNVVLFPDENGRVVFYAENYLASRLTLAFPEPDTSDFSSADNQQLFFWIEYRQITNKLPNNTWVLTERGQKRVMLRGGVEKQKFERNNFFEYYNQVKGWLTWRPSGKFVSLTQQHYLSWLRTSDAVVNFTLITYVYYTDGTNDSITQDLTDANNYVYHFPVGVEVLGLDQLFPNKKIHYYECQVVNSDNNAELTSRFRFYIDYDHYYHWFEWSYENSLGGIDSERIRGSFNLTAERRVQKSTRLAVMQELNELFKEGGEFDAGIVLDRKWTGDVGFSNTKEEQEALLELFQSKNIYETISGRWLKVNILNENNRIAGSDDTRFPFALEWRYSYNSEVFTPWAKWFGNGSNNDSYGDPVGACPNPTNLTATVGVVNAGSVPISFEWNHSGTDVMYIEYRENGSNAAFQPMGIATQSPVSIGLPADGKTYNWRLRALCLNEDFSSYVNGPNFTVPSDPAACSLPTALSFSKGTPSFGVVPFTFTWNHASATSFTLAYRPYFAGGNWVEVEVSGTSTTINFPDDGETYAWRVRANCTPTSSSPFINGSPFVASSASTCDAPFNLNVQFVSETSTEITFRFTWDHASATVFIIRYELFTQTVPDEQEVNAKTIDITFSKDSGRYRWRVAAKCSSVDYSLFTEGQRFQA